MSTRMLLAATNSVALWTPSQITTNLWLDSSDITTVTRVSSVVSQWNDKSGNAGNATQATAANRPAYNSNKLNNLPLITFDGSNDSLSLTSGVYTTSPSIWVIVNGTTPSAPVLRLQTSTTEIYLSVISSTSYPRLVASRRGQTQYGVDIPNFFYNILHADSGSSGGATWSYYINGTASTTLQDLGTSSGTANQNVIGINENSTNPFSGSIAEIIVTPGSVSSGTRQLVEGYLANKWGLTFNLPSDHPYKNNPPLVL